LVTIAAIGDHDQFDLPGWLESSLSRAQITDALTSTVDCTP
jgi:hypothetical protein